MNRSLDAGLRDIAVVKGDVHKGRYADENKAGDSEKKGSEVSFLSGLRDGDMEWTERCVLKLLAADPGPEITTKILPLLCSALSLSYCLYSSPALSTSLPPGVEEMDEAVALKLNYRVL